MKLKKFLTCNIYVYDFIREGIYFQLWVFEKKKNLTNCVRSWKIQLEPQSGDRGLGKLCKSYILFRKSHCESFYGDANRTLARSRVSQESPMLGVRYVSFLYECPSHFHSDRILIEELYPHDKHKAAAALVKRHDTFLPHYASD